VSRERSRVRDDNTKSRRRALGARERRRRARESRERETTTTMTMTMTMTCVPSFVTPRRRAVPVVVVARPRDGARVSASASRGRGERATRSTRRVRRDAGANDEDDGNDDDDAIEAASAIDASIEEMKTLAVDEVEAMMSANEGVRAELARVRSDARTVATREIEKVEANEKERVREAFEEAQQRTEASQSKAERAAEEAAALKRDAVAQAEAKMAALAAEREALREELAKESVGGKWADDAIDEAAEKMESAKAAAVGGGGGGALAAPLLVSQGGGLLSVAFAALSCAVFGVTYRYAVRRDVENSELKGGVVGAFGLARGLSAADVYLRAAALNGDLDVASYAQAALLAGQGVLTFAFAALALEQAFERGIVKPFGVASEEKTRR